jgi:uncharacterized metal-binding protein
MGNLVIYEILYISIIFIILTLLPFQIQELKKKNMRKRKKRNQSLMVALKNYFKKLYNHLRKDLLVNVFANYVLSPYVFLLAIFWLNKYFNLALLDEAEPFNYKKSAISGAVVFSIFYLYASQYFQPDLDMRSTRSRPGMKHFPLGYVVGYYPWGRFLKWVCTPITLIWQKIWDVYAFFCTHRGLSHYPIIGLWTRVAYLLLYFYAAEFLIQKNLLNNMPIFYTLKDWLESFFPWHKNFSSFNFFIMNFSIYMSDTVHWIVDYWDSAKRGLKFCSQKIPRGFFVRQYYKIKSLFMG